jgi:hypothetical protein
LRQRLIFSVLSDLSILSRNQIQLLLFNEASGYAEWKTCERLKKFYDAGLVKRGRCNVENCYVYWLDQKPEDPDRVVLVNWVYVYLRQTGQLEEFIREYKCNENLIADAYFIFRGEPYFLVFHRLANKPPVSDMLQKYIRYAESEQWLTNNWPGGNQFAGILIVCETEESKLNIAKVVHQENVLNLRVSVCTLEKLGEDTLAVMKYYDARAELTEGKES